MLRAGPDLAASCSCPPRGKEATGCRAPLIAWWLVAPPSNEPSNPNRRDLTAPWMAGLLGGQPHLHRREGLGRWLDTRRPPTPQLLELGAPSLHPRADASFLRTRAAPSAGHSAPGRRDVSGKNSWPKCCFCEDRTLDKSRTHPHPCSRWHLRNETGCLSPKCKARPPFGEPGPQAPGPRPPEHLPRPRLVPGWSRSPHTPPSLAPEAPDV